MTTKYDGTVEVVGSPIIVNKERKIFGIIFSLRKNFSLSVRSQI